MIHPKLEFNYEAANMCRFKMYRNQIIKPILKSRGGKIGHHSQTSYEFYGFELNKIDTFTIRDVFISPIY